MPTLRDRLERISSDPEAAVRALTECARRFDAERDKLLPKEGVPVPASGRFRRRAPRPVRVPGVLRPA